MFTLAPTINVVPLRGLLVFSLFFLDSGDGVSLNDWGRAYLWLLSEKHGQQRPLLWSVKRRGELTLVVVTASNGIHTQKDSQYPTLPSMVAMVSWLVMAPHTLGSQSTSSAAPNSAGCTSVQTHADPSPFPTELSRFNLFVWLCICLRQVPLHVPFSQPCSG